MCASACCTADVGEKESWQHSLNTTITYECSLLLFVASWFNASLCFTRVGNSKSRNMPYVCYVRYVCCLLLVILLRSDARRCASLQLHSALMLTDPFRCAGYTGDGASADGQRPAAGSCAKGRQRPEQRYVKMEGKDEGVKM